MALGMALLSVHHFGPEWSMKYQNNYLMDCYEIMYKNSWSPEGES